MRIMDSSDEEFLLFDRALRNFILRKLELQVSTILTEKDKKSVNTNDSELSTI